MKQGLMGLLIVVLVASAAEAATEKKLEFPLGREGGIKTWLALGYIPLPVPAELPALKASGKAFDEDFLVRAGGEAKVTPLGGATVDIAGKTYTWKLVKTNNFKIPLFYDSAMKPMEKQVIYFYCQLASPKELKGKLLLGTDDATKVFLNGKEIHRYIGMRSARKDQDEVPITLLKGTNSLLVRIDNYYSGGGICARLVDEKGDPMKSVKVELPEEDNTPVFAYTNPAEWKNVIKQIPPLPPLPNEAFFGSRMTRVMSLLSTAHFTKRPVRIVFYGQSIVSQRWTEYVIDRLRERFPEAEIIYNKPSIGGFTVPSLIKTIKHDVFRLRPDLVVFHAYGGNDGTRERLVNNLRKETTADILLFTHHLSRAEGEKGYSKGLEQSSANIRRIAQKYNCELADVRKGWKQYLKTYPQFKIADLLKDGVHLNHEGCILMAELVESHFRDNPLFQSEWGKRVRRVSLSRALDDKINDEITLTGPSWTKTRRGASASSPKDKLTMKFTGNRVDLIVGPSKGGINVLIDGKKPSELNLYHATRPNSKVGKFASLSRVFTGPNMVPENWTLTFTEMKRDKDNKRIADFKYKIEGSVTGPDGEGGKSAPFVSKSGRIKIFPSDFCLAVRYADKALKTGLVNKWRILPDYLDVVPAVSNRSYITLADGLSNGEHELTLSPVGDGKIQIDAVEIHQPPY